MSGLVDRASAGAGRPSVVCGRLTMSGRQPDERKLDAIVAKARTDAAARDRGYREQALKLYPWVCGRCGRTFERANLRELTVHHRNHNHDDNPVDGSNWELLCS